MESVKQYKQKDTPPVLLIEPPPLYDFKGVLDKIIRRGRHIHVSYI